MGSLTEWVEIQKARLYGKEVQFIDTPGFNDSRADGRSDSVVLRVNGVTYLRQVCEEMMHGTGRPARTKVKRC